MEFIGDEDEFIDQSKRRRAGGRPAINKKNKRTIVFDPESRRKFLTGFSKRKQERKEKYQEKLEKDLAEEKKKMREEAKKSVAKKQSSSHSIIPEIQHLLEDDSSSEEEEVATTYDVGCTTVSILNLGSKLFPQHSLKKEEPEESEEDEPGFLLYDSKPSTGLEKDAVKLKKVKQVLKNPMDVVAKTKTETLVRQETHRLLQHSDVFKKALKMKQQRSKKFKLNRLQPQEDGSKGKTKSKQQKGKIKVRTRGKPTTVN